MDPNTQAPTPEPVSPQHSPQELFSGPNIPVDLTPPTPPKSGKKLKFVLLGLAILFVIGGVSAVILGRSDSNKPESTTTAFNPSSDTVQLSKEFLTNVQNEKYQEALLLIKPENNRTQQLTMDQIRLAGYLKQNYPISDCQTKGSTSQDTVIIYACKNDKNKEILIQFTARKMDDKTVLSGFNMIDEKSNS